ncbi:patatin-like phospholipase family protein [Clostridium felsineum]|uniref:patatin-like phospholipase family protein n=1 Tax=Clostridium felsineum TaxID=36839 RepID=UPI00214D600F|nr:patatin-like phospholipase family protein [Clostridium felsineum]MCR3761296.1 patatin-like phospholipase family protein [Clostridium felsineum]
MKKILSIDGGGIKGVFPATILKIIEENILKENENIYEYFDIITGTSTGAIIALGLGLGISADKILELYEKMEMQYLKEIKVFQNVLNQ